jgi:hypothetical protein
MNKLITRVCKLLSIKSIVTLALTSVVVVQALKGQFDIRDIYIMIMGFYFGTQSVNDAKTNDKVDG